MEDIRKTYPLLPVKVVPKRYESCKGYILRVAAANGYPSSAWIFQLESLLKHPQYQNKRAVAEALKRLVGLTVSESRFLDSSLLIKKHIYEKYYSNNLRICPECLQIDKCMDFMWEIIFASACPYHSIYLLDTCPRCHTNLSWNTSDPLFCRCGADLTLATVNQASSQVLYYNSKMWLAMGRRIPKVSLPDFNDELLCKLGLNELCNVYSFLFRVGQAEHVHIKSKLKQVSQVIQAFDVIHSMLSDWPKGLHKFLETQRKEDGSFEGEGLQQGFGGFYRRLYNNDELKFIQEAFESYVFSHWSGVIDNKYNRVSPNCKSSYTLAGKAAKKLGISKVRLNRLIDMGIVDGTRKSRPSGRCYTLLKYDETKRFYKVAKFMINKSQTCQMMGISKKQFDILVAGEIIKPLMKPGDMDCLEWCCDSRKIFIILKDILSLVPKQKPNAEAISFSKICRCYLTTIKILPQFLRMILRGKIKIAGMDISSTDDKFKLSSLYFDLEEILRIRKNLQKNKANVFTIPEVAIIMKVKQEVVYYIVNAGFLECFKTSTSRNCRMISKTVLQKFEKTFIPLVAIAKCRRGNTRMILKTLNDLGVFPAIGGTTDGCRQIFYKRSHLPKAYRCSAHLWIDFKNYRVQ